MVTVAKIFATTLLPVGLALLILVMILPRFINRPFRWLVTKLLSRKVMCINTEVSILAILTVVSAMMALTGIITASRASSHTEMHKMERLESKWRAERDFWMGTLGTCAFWLLNVFCAAEKELDELEARAPPSPQRAAGAGAPTAAAATAMPPSRPAGTQSRQPAAPASSPHPAPSAPPASEADSDDASPAVKRSAVATDSDPDDEEPKSSRLSKRRA